jgi:hypothetical protein
MTWWNRDCFVGKNSLPSRNDGLGSDCFSREKTEALLRDDGLRGDCFVGVKQRRLLAMIREVCEIFLFKIVRRFHKIL